MTGTLTLREIARALHGEVSGQQVRAPGPGHSRIDRSLTIRLSPTAPDGFVVFSHADDDFAACRDHVRDRLGLDPNGWKRRPEVNQHIVMNDHADRAVRIDRAVMIWAEAHDAHGTVVQTYLEGRGLSLPESADAIRYHARCPWRDEEAGRTIRVPAMICLFRSIATDEQLGIHRTRLTEAGVKVDRRMLGIAAGGAVKIDADDTVEYGLHLAEGVETALAGRQLGFKPVWALGSAGGIAAFPVLSGVEALTLLGENDATNARAVEACASRWHAAGKEVALVEPLLGSDMNDVVRGAA